MEVAVFRETNPMGTTDVGTETNIDGRCSLDIFRFSKPINGRNTKNLQGPVESGVGVTGRPNKNTTDFGYCIQL